jgi:hypothetical protein
MNQQNTEQQVAQISENVEKINRRLGGSGMAFWRGILSGFGYIIGAFIAVLLIGWVLNAIGVIPAFKAQVESLKSTLQQAQPRQVPGQK